MDLSFGLGAIAVIAFAVAVTLSLLRAAPTVRPFLYLISGIGVGGLAADLLARAASGVVGAFGRTTALVLGTGVGIALVIAIGIYLVVKMRPKGGSPTKLTNALAFVFPALLAAVGMGAIVSLAGEGVATAAQAIGTIVSDLVGSF